MKKLKRRCFKVVDSDGPWGAVSQKSASEAVARREASAKLRKTEVWPKGSLLPDFKLTRMTK
jgi:hypothetical protein